VHRLASTSRSRSEFHSVECGQPEMAASDDFDQAFLATHATSLTKGFLSFPPLIWPVVDATSMATLRVISIEGVWRCRSLARIRSKHIHLSGARGKAHGAYAVCPGPGGTLPWSRSLSGSESGV
jgi:hypothetical protein